MLNFQTPRILGEKIGISPVEVCSFCLRPQGRFFMAISRQKKEETIAAFEKSMQQSKIVVFVNFQGMNVANITDLRNSIRECGGSIQVLKKTLIQRVLDESKVDINTLVFEGEIAAVFGFQDEIGVVKILSAFAKEKDHSTFRGGVMGSVLLDEEALAQLARIPGRDELLAKAVGSLAAPMSGIVNVFVGNMRNLVYALNAIGKNYN